MIERQLAQVAGRELVRFEERVGKRLEQVIDEARVVVGAKGMQVDAEHLRELDEHGSGQRPTIGLDEIEVARRDAEPLGEVGLAHAFAAAKAANLGAEPRRFVALLLFHVLNSIDSTCSTTWH